MSEQNTTIDQLANHFVEQQLELIPELGTSLGVDLHQDKWSDYSPAGAEALADVAKDTLRALRALPDQSEGDAVTRAALEDRLGVSLALHEAGEPLRNVNNIDSPIQEIRGTFALMPAETEAQRAAIASRLGQVEAALRGYRESLQLGLERGLAPSARGVELAAQQAQDLTKSDSVFDIYGEPAGATSEQIASAKRAMGEIADFLRQEVAPQASAEDAVGRERYQLFSHQHVGHRIDLDETYEWGKAELARIIAEQEATARELYGPGVSVPEALSRLNEDPARQLHGKEALREWMQGIADEAISNLHGTHFEIPQPVRRIECCIDPSGTGGIYYTGPSEDFTRPGRMWWSVPEGEDTFVTWQELTTVYHEGVPGHHLQIGQQTFEAERLNRWRRSLCFNSGHAEGWALYAERLMADMGYLDEPGVRMGMLDGQRLRAARVVLDIGVHLGKPRLSGEGVWDADYAWSFMKDNVAMADGFLRFEVDRYLTWPGQAPSYKVGQRLWEQLRDEYLGRKLGDLKDFHRVALREGSLPMGVLRDVVLQSL
ncbi:DUF885 domain-containing protein [Boudabousia marimammalium]|uniref:DUF885 domain-containing protein n=1 Tax=Boudabousia marimammalium TaxID=156892 RepID=A0A1Q5PJE7_9ACTO|nr:DUF885 domain-containing protein [Boudabousia marimammalium]OKL46013.1 hypothetical protein BM477_07500 [Boudabousia marimammalium]